MKKIVFGIALFSAAAAIGVPTGYAESSVTAERVQVFLDPDTGTLARRMVRVIDQHPELKLEFLWEPERAGVETLGSDGMVEGRGKLTWRLAGAADYDRSAVFSVYEGDIRGGLPHGEGRLTLRSGERMEGHFSAGVLDGSGWRTFANGDRYDGAFRAGRADGTGRLARADGSIYQGRFENGEPHGEGHMAMADGTQFDSQWIAGHESGPRRNVQKAPSNAGGLVHAQQASGGDAAKMQIGFTIDERLNQEAGMQYQNLVRDEDVAIYPLEQEINDAWAGSRQISGGTWPFDMTDWEDAPAFVEMNLATTDGSKVKIDSLELQVSESQAVLKPFLALQGHEGCVGFRPTFNFLNFGWGEARDAKLTMTFTNEDGTAETKEFSAPLGTFDQGLDVSLRDVLAQAGVDVAALDSKRFKCASADEIETCKAEVLKDVSFGEVKPTVWGDDRLYTTATGKVDYSWVDANGDSWDQSEPFRVDIALARIEYPAELAECGDGFPGSPEALRYIDVDLPLGRKDYSVPIAVRGNKSIKDYTARLKMHSERTSFHSLRGVAHFADGSTLQSKPVSFYFFHPRTPEFTSQATPAACYLPPDDSAC
jgi:hypothetical protein